MERILLDDRLRAAADLVRQGAYFADIGTDHAYLPVFLLEENRIRRAYASDIAEGPVSRAAEAIRKYHREKGILLFQRNGLTGLFRDFPEVTDIAVCGMGGELIASLLEAEPAVKNPSIHLILQPMSRPAALRRYLSEKGFSVSKEVLALAAGRIYSCLLAAYTGVPSLLSPLEAEVGSYYLNPENPKDEALYSRYIQEKMAVLEDIIAGKRLGSRDTREENARLHALQNLQNERKTL